MNVHFPRNLKQRCGVSVRLLPTPQKSFAGRGRGPAVPDKNLIRLSRPALLELPYGRQ